MMAMKAAALFAWIVLGALLPTGSFAENRCEPILAQRVAGAGFLEQCGDKLRSFALKPTDARWHEGYQYHVGFWFTCLVTPDLGLLSQFPDYVATQRKPCLDEPRISGAFTGFDERNTPSQEDEAILHAALGNRLNGPLAAAACPVFDLSVGSARGRATCVKEGKTSAIVARFQDEWLAFVLVFSQEEKPLDALKDAQMILSTQFTIERGTGDAALMRWVP